MSGDTVQGLDCSKYQNPTPSLSGAHFLIAKATEGTQPDPMYDRHIAAARAAGIHTGAYHFNYSPLAVGPQVTAFLAKAGSVDLFALDYEGSNRFSRTQTREFIARVQATGRRIGLYASESVFFDAGQDWDWVANYSQEPRRRYDMWQYGPFHGADGNRFNGTLDQLRAFVGAATGDDMAIYIKEPASGHFDIATNATLRRWKPTTAGWAEADPWTGHSATTVAFTTHLARLAGTSVPASLLGGLSGAAFAGLYVSTADVTEVLDLVPGPVETPAADCSAIQSQLDTANGRIRQAITVLGGTQP